MSSQSKKTDNAYFDLKLQLRSQMLKEYHDAPLNVFDCCRGEGRLWKELRKTFPVATYLGTDVKPGKGLTMRSERLLLRSDWTFDVIDIDTYGSPWKHWLALLPHVPHDLTVFLTIGMVKIAGGVVDKFTPHILGIESLPIPNVLLASLEETVRQAMLARAFTYGLSIVSALEAAPSGHNTRYLAVRLKKR